MPRETLRPLPNKKRGKGKKWKALNLLYSKGRTGGTFLLKKKKKGGKLPLPYMMKGDAAGNFGYPAASGTLGSSPPGKGKKKNPMTPIGEGTVHDSIVLTHRKEMIPTV